MSVICREEAAARFRGTRHQPAGDVVDAPPTRPVTRSSSEASPTSQAPAPPQPQKEHRRISTLARVCRIVV